MDDDYPPPRRGGPGLGTVIVVSALTSAAATVLTLFAIARLHLPVPLPAAPIATAPAAASTPGAAADAARSGDEDFVLPNLARVPVESARSLLGTLHLRLSVRGLRADPTVPAESVIEQSPASGARVRRGEIVEVVVSTGPSAPPADASGPAVALVDASADVPSELVEVPQFVGQRFARVRTMLEQAGLTLGRRREGDDPDRSAYVVLAQSIPRGTRVARGTAIDLVVNAE